MERSAFKPTYAEELMWRSCQFEALLKRDFAVEDETVRALFYESAFWGAVVNLIRKIGDVKDYETYDKKLQKADQNSSDAFTELLEQINVEVGSEQGNKLGKARGDCISAVWGLYNLIHNEIRTKAIGAWCGPLRILRDCLLMDGDTRNPSFETIFYWILKLLMKESSEDLVSQALVSDYVRNMQPMLTTR